MFDFISGALLVHSYAFRNKQTPYLDCWSDLFKTLLGVTDLAGECQHYISIQLHQISPRFRRTGSLSSYVILILHCYPYYIGKYKNIARDLLYSCFYI